MTGRRMWGAAVLLLALVAGTAVRADVFVDDFETARDYVVDGTAGTIWDDFIGWMAGETVDSLNASLLRPGQLYIASVNGTWDSPWSPLGPFIYKVVKGDFIASVKVTDYAGTSAAPVLHNDGGLMARAFRSDAGAGEDWVSIDYFPIWNCGNFLWMANDNVRNEAWGCNNGKRWNLDPWLQLERKGSVFHARTSQDGVNWTEMPCSPKTRADLAGVPLMVGLRHATYSSTLGYVAFDDFRLETFVATKALGPTPEDGAFTPGVSQLVWKPGDFAVKHDVYMGTSLDVVTNATTATADVYLGRQDPNSYVVSNLTPGTTYYWRIDEVNDNHPDKLWKGDVWSYTVVPLTAWAPKPATGAECVPVDADLAWSAGTTAARHEVYFGTDATAVGAATTTNKLGVYKGIKVTGIFDPGAMTADTTYYWRVDEVEKNGTTRYKGTVWSFKTLAAIPVADTHLVGWWKLEGGCVNNSIAIDSSGYGHHGAMKGNPQAIPGYDGSALKFDGRDDHVELPIGDLIASLTNSTFMIWADFSNSGGAWQRIFDFGTDDPNVHMFLTPRKFFIDPMRFGITKSGNGYQIASDADCTDAGVVLPSGWHNVAVTIDPAVGATTLYLDGEQVGTSATVIVPKDLGKTTHNWLGRSGYEDDAYYLGSLDDFRIYDYALSVSEITRAMAGDPLQAWSPTPANGSTPDAEHVPALSWSAGTGATQHDVYFGKDVNEVTQATAASTGVFRGTLDSTTYSLTDALDSGTTYYWRIDEHGATVTKGKIWSFAVPSYLVIDDMESYGAVDKPGAAGSRIWYAWNDGYGWTTPAPGDHGDGTGAMVDLVTTPVNSGRRALRLDYRNDGSMVNAFGEAKTAYTSELRRTFDPAQDWTRRDVKRLVLWFRGVGTNAQDPLYVTLQDSTGKATAVVDYSNAAAAAEAAWHEWTIDLASVSKAGVKLTDIKTLVIGVGKPNATQAGGRGTVYFDDIRLVP